MTTTAAQALAEVVRRHEDCGADELRLVRTTSDRDGIDRIVDAIS